MITTKKCPMCAEEIPLEAKVCEYCGTRFDVSIKNGRVKSRSIEEPVKQPALTTLPHVAAAKQGTPWGWIAGGLGLLLILAVIGAFLWFGRIGIPAAPSLFTTDTPTATSTFTPTLSPTVTSTRIPSPTPTATPLPAWVTDFAEPILSAIANFPPTIQDDFHDNSGGWYEASGCDRDRRISFVDGEVIFGCELYRSNMAYKDFVLEFDTHFVQGKANTGQLRIEYRNAYEFLLDSNGNMTLFMAAWYKTGYLNYFPPSRALGNNQTNHMLIIAKGNRYAFYVNGIPVHYLEDVYYFTSEPIIFNIMDGGNTAVALDNLKIWDLEKIPNLP